MFCAHLYYFWNGGGSIPPLKLWVGYGGIIPLLYNYNKNFKNPKNNFTPLIPLQQKKFFAKKLF
jgi:hypothetical protein